MFDLVSSWLMAIWPYQPETQPVMVGDLSGWVQSSNANRLLEPLYSPNPLTVSAVTKHINALKASGLPTEQQGIWFQSGRTVLAEHQGREPLPAASLTKIATTLVTLHAWGISYQFETLLSYRGIVEDGVLDGDLIVQGSGDPFFVWEEAIAMGNTLNEIGIHTITGNLIISGSFAMNFRAEPDVAGVLLRQGMNADLWPFAAQQQFAAMTPGTPRPSVTIQGQVLVRPEHSAIEGTERNHHIQGNQAQANHLSGHGILEDGGAAGIVASGEAIAPAYPDQIPLVRHQSVPLIEMLRQMNIYSNNFMADALANGVGGASFVAEQAAVITGIPEREIQLINGSGLGVENRISARAASAMLMSINGMLQRSNWSVADVFPVAGLDEGTIQTRDLPNYSAVKTGTLATVSALAGAIPTDDVEQEVVWFSVINWGSDLEGLRDRQDSLLKDLRQRSTTAGAIARSDDQRGRELELGAPERNEILARF